MSKNFLGFNGNRTRNYNSDGEHYPTCKGCGQVIYPTDEKFVWTNSPQNVKCFHKNCLCETINKKTEPIGKVGKLPSFTISFRVDKNNSEGLAYCQSSNFLNLKKCGMFSLAYSVPLNSNSSFGVAFDDLRLFCDNNNFTLTLKCGDYTFKGKLDAFKEGVKVCRTYALTPNHRNADKVAMLGIEIFN